MKKASVKKAKKAPAKKVTAKKVKKAPAKKVKKAPAPAEHPVSPAETLAATLYFRC